MGLLTNGAPDKVGGRVGVGKMVKKDFIHRAVNKQCLYRKKKSKCHASLQGGLSKINEWMPIF